MDLVIVEISPDNVNWYTVLYWGNASNDFNTNLTGLSPESDNYRVAATSLYNNSGIAIDIDALGLTGSYPFIKFTDPGTGDGADIDAIQLLH